MSTEETNTSLPAAEPAAVTASAASSPRPRRFGLVALGILALGLAGGAAAGMTLARGPEDTTPAKPATVATLSDSGVMSLKGKVVEIYGNKFVLQDGSGRALIETGRAGEDGDLVKANEEVTVEGRFEHGFLHARSLTHADGTVATLRLPPPPPPHHGPRPGGPGPDGWGPEGRGPDGRGPDGWGPGRADCGPAGPRHAAGPKHGPVEGPDRGPDQAGMQPPPPPLERGETPDAAPPAAPPAAPAAAEPAAPAPAPAQ
ncbi:hypothetical protein [Rhizobium rhizosphaerae]|uniref:hypothetical protein n=1 Tax=Xaviernesmea rhizosphaerae TaxID=1672749 RepID=UPI000AE7C4E8|nr:hypothetical protein [Xaviernesmea rhizosphaerae]